MENFIKICKTLDDTKELAKAFIALVGDEGIFVNLYGEIGAGKTAFVKLAAEELGVKEKVTSPSFVILNEYHSSKLPLYHFDLYRLEKEGVKTIVDELREYTKNCITFVEWAEFSQDEIPFEHLKINVTYGDNEERIYEFIPQGIISTKIVEGLK